VSQEARKHNSGFLGIDDSSQKRGDSHTEPSKECTSNITANILISPYYKEETSKENKKNTAEHSQEIFAYKKVANRIKPIATTLPKEFRIVQKIPSDLIAELPILPTLPPEFAPGKRYTQERKKMMPVNKDRFLWPEEEKLVHYMIKIHKSAFAWTEEEKGKFTDEYFKPVVIPMIKHMPWVLKNIPIPPGIYDRVVKIIKDKIQSGVYEHSNSSYRSRWFCVSKKDKTALWMMVHDLQPLNTVAIKDSVVPPMIEPYAESFWQSSMLWHVQLICGIQS